MPFFTNNALSEKPAKRHPWLEHTSAAALMLAIAMDVGFGAEEGPLFLHVGILLLAALLHGAKLVAWRPWAMISRPILWILPLSYAWLPIGLLLRAVALLDFGNGVAVDPMLGLHGITVGAIGGMMLAMMTRSSLGHTGRAIHASPIDIIIYIFIAACPVVRVFGPMLMPAYYMDMISISAALWCVAFCYSLFAIGHSSHVHDIFRRL